MAINILESDHISSMEPLTSTRTLSACVVGGKTLKAAQIDKIKKYLSTTSEKQITIVDYFWPSANLAKIIATYSKEAVINDKNDNCIGWISDTDIKPNTENIISIDDDSLIISYPWELLAINSEIMDEMSENDISGTVREGVTIDGFVTIGEGSVILPGVYMEGNVIIGENCKIGPNCYFRGSSSVGNNCHIGQAVEIKNSIIMDGVGAGHLSYVGDSIIGENSNLGAGTITANFRHDGKNHRSEVDGEIIDTGRRKFGTIFGDDVHTGIHTSIYPARKIWAHKSTLPGTVVNKDIK